MWYYGRHWMIMIQSRGFWSEVNKHGLFVCEVGGDMKSEELLKQVKAAVHEVEPDANIILYGSRSRGDSVTDSDWDFLILVDGPVSDERTDRIRHQLYEIEWESEAVLSSIVRSRDEWETAKYRSMPFHQRVEREGKRL